MAMIQIISDGMMSGGQAPMLADICALAMTMTLLGNIKVERIFYLRSMEET